jgi:hypothetical protein
MKKLKKSRGIQKKSSNAKSALKLRRLSRKRKMNRNKN